MLLPYLVIAAGMPIAAASIAILHGVEVVRYGHKSPAPGYRPMRMVMMKPSGMATADARNVMPTSNANFLWGCMVIFF